MCVSLKHPKHSQISYWILIFCSDSLSEGHPVIFFPLSSVIIPFPPCERKDQNNPAEIYGSPGAEPLCWSKWKTRAAVAEWDTARSRVSRPPGARCIDTDTGHYMIRLYGDHLGGWSNYTTDITIPAQCFTNMTTIPTPRFPPSSNALSAC